MPSPYSLEASVAGFSKLALPPPSAVQGCKFDCSLICPRRRLSVCRRRARSTRASPASLINRRYHRRLQCGAAIVIAVPFYGRGSAPSPCSRWLATRYAHASAAYRGATRRPLRDVPCGARYRRRRRGWTSFHFITSAASMGDSLLHAGVPQHSNVRPSGLGYSCTMVCDGEKSALALSLQRCFCRLPLTDGSCGSVRQTFVPELMSARGGRNPVPRQ